MYYQWMALQRGVDAAALAGVNSLPNQPATAATTVQTYANSNGVKNDEITAITCIDTVNGSYACSQTAKQPANFNPSKVQVDASRVVPYYFARVLGLTNATIKVSSTALLPLAPSCLNCCVVNCNSSSPPGSPGGPSPSSVPVSDSGSACGTSSAEYDLIPIAVDNKTVKDWSPNSAYTLNRASPNGNGPWPDAPGNWGNVSLCGGGNGGAALRSSIANGFHGSMAVDQTLQTEPGAKVGPVNQGFADYLNGHADNWANGWSMGDPRAVMVPVVDFSNCRGRCVVPITGFMTFYIDSYSNGAISGHFITMMDPGSVANGAAGDAGLAGQPVLVK
jgi:hypothetical protein